MDSLLGCACGTCEAGSVECSVDWLYMFHQFGILVNGDKDENNEEVQGESPQLRE